MKFFSYDTKSKKECESVIRNADLNTAHVFVQTWVTDYAFRILSDPEFSYNFFPWDKIIALTLIVGSPMRCHGVFTDERLEGLICLGMEKKKLKIEFIATAPWNYYKIGKMRRIGSGMIYYVIRVSTYKNLEGEFYLNALPDAENFYEDIIGMIATGKTNDEGLREYFMSKENADSFSKQFKKYVIKT